MNLIQKEMLLKAARLGCTVEGADADSPLEVRKDGVSRHDKSKKFLNQKKSKNAYKLHYIAV